MNDLIMIETLGLAITATGLDLIRANHKKAPNRNILQECLMRRLKNFDLSTSFIPEIVSLLLKVSNELSTQIPSISENLPEPFKPHSDEKKEYWIYSHEKPTKPFPASKKEIDELENLSLEEKRSRFDIFFSEEKNEAITQGKVKDFSTGRKEATQLKKLLYLFLSHVGRFVGFEDINDVVWGDQLKQLKKSSDIHQLKDRLIKFIGEPIKPFITSGKSLVGKDGQNVGITDRYYIKESSKGIKFKYCMILCKNSVNLDDD